MVTILRNNLQTTIDSNVYVSVALKDVPVKVGAREGSPAFCRLSPVVTPKKRATEEPPRETI